MNEIKEQLQGEIPKYPCQGDDGRCVDCGACEQVREYGRKSETFVRGN